MSRRSSMVAIQMISALALAALPFLTRGTYYTYLALLILIYGIAAIGLNILVGYAGQLSLGHAAFMAIGAYVSALLSKAMAGLSLGGLHVWLGVLAGTIGAALCGCILALPALRVRGPYLAMVTIAFGWIVWKILLEWVSVTGGDLGLSSIPRAQLGSLLLDTRGLYYVVLILFLAVFVIQGRLIASQYGMQIRAIRHSETIVASAGVDVDRVKFTTFVISAAICGFAGALFAHQQSYINPDSFRIFDSVFLLLTVLFGGGGTNFGPIVGTTVLIVLPEMLHAFDQYRLIVYGGLILFILYWMPKGIVGEFLKWVPVGQMVWGRKRNLVSTNFSWEKMLATTGASLQIDGVSHSFGGVVALSDVHFRVEKGSIHALIGPNGAGKTTLVNIVTGVHPPKNGHVVIDGILVKRASLSIAARQGIVRTFQNVKTLGEMTTIEHVLIGLSGRAPIGFWGTLRASRRDREKWSRQWDEARELLKVVGIAHLELVPANALSLGHRRLVDIARALAARPRVLLLDEPAAGLVGDEVSNMALLIKRLRDIGITIVLVEHNMDLVLSVSDEVTVLDHGVVIANGPPETIRHDERVITAYLGPSYADA